MGGGGLRFCALGWKCALAERKIVPPCRRSFSNVLALVTQPMLQRRPNCTELRSMDSYTQILCRFQKCKQKVPPPSLPYSKKKKGVFFTNKFYFPEIYLFRHFSKSCSVFYIL